jgi:outer membrane protein assembly factor BamB
MKRIYAIVRVSEMLKFLDLRLFLLLVFLFLLSSHNGIAATGPGKNYLSSELLRKAGLEVAWEYELPLKKTEELRRLLILGDNIYPILNSDYVVSLNKETGSVVFGRNISLEGLPLGKMHLYDGVLMSVGGSRIIEIDPRTGIKLQTVNVGFPLLGAAARNETNYYLSGIDNRLHVISVSNKVNVFEATAENDSKITAVLADEIDGEQFVVFATDKGNIIGMDPDRPVMRWQFTAAGAVVGSLVKDGRSLYFACKDMNIYRLDIVGSPKRVRLVWKYQTNGILNQAPNLTRNTVYQYVQDKGLTAVNKDGSFLWMVERGVAFLAESDWKAYVLTNDNMLAVMDNLNKKRLYSVNFTGVTNYATNVVNSKIYIVVGGNKIECLQPIR